MTGKIVLKRGKERPLHNHHPLIFSGAIQRADVEQDGDTVDVFDASGEWLARAAFNSRSQIVGRVWTFERDETIDRAFFERRIVKAKELRDSHAAYAHQRPQQPLENAYRIINAESDFLPGVVADRYGEYI